MGFDGGEIEPLTLQIEIRPSLDQLLMERIELIALGRCGLQPIPLHDGRLEQRGRRVGVIFQEARRRSAVVGQVEAAVEIFLLRRPAAGHRVPGDARDAQPFEGLFAAVDHAVDQRQAHLLQFGGRLFERVDLLRREAVAGRLVPIKLAGNGVELEPQVALDMSAPVRPRRDGLPLQIRRPRRC
jgi:hypothetical protein